jgi:hypothetical protein
MTRKCWNCIGEFTLERIGQFPVIVFITITDDLERLLGIDSREDKIFQRAVMTVLKAIYEEDFLGFLRTDSAWDTASIMM